MSHDFVRSEITAQGLSVFHSESRVVNEVSFDLEIGQVHGVLGANAAGKTSLLNALSGDCTNVMGSLFLGTQCLRAMSVLDLARCRAVLPQHAGLTFDLGVKEVIQMGAYPFPEASPAQVEYWVSEALADADLSHLQHSGYAELSGGEQQRVQFARVLVQARAIAHFKGYAWILLDEPTSSLDPRHQHMLMKKIKSMTKSGSYGVIVVLHDLNLAARWCDRLLLMKSGQLIANNIPVLALSASNLFSCFEIHMHVIPHPLCSQQLLVLVNDE